MRCDTCKYRLNDGHTEPCRHCIECGVPYIEDTPGDLYDYYSPDLTDYEAEARAAIEKARNESGGSYNSGYLAGYADALKKVAGLEYYAVSSDGGYTYRWKWLSPAEVAQLRAEGCDVRK